MRKYHLLLFFTTFLSLCQSQKLSAQQVNWLSIEQAESKQKQAPKKIMIDVYTKWCTACKSIDNAAATQPQTARFINDYYYAAKLDAEHPTPLTFKGKTYKYVTQSGVGFNELAAELLKGQLQYPTLVFFDENANFIQAIQYKSPEQFNMVVMYFGQDHYKTMPWAKFEKMYTPSAKRN